MRSQATLFRALCFATSLATLTIGGCGIFIKQPPRYNTPVGERRAPSLNPGGAGLKDFDPRAARQLYESESDNLQAEKNYPLTPQSQQENQYPPEPVATPSASEEMSAVPTPPPAPMNEVPMPQAGQAAPPAIPGATEGPSPLYYLEQQGVITPLAEGESAATQTAQAQGESGAPARYEPAMPGAAPAPVGKGYPRLTDVPPASDQLKEKAVNLRQDARDAIADEQGDTQRIEQRRQDLTGDGAELSSPPATYTTSPQMSAEQAAPAEAPQQRQYVTGDSAPQPNGEGTPAVSARDEFELRHQMLQEQQANSVMAPAEATAMEPAQAAPAEVVGEYSADQVAATPAAPQTAPAAEYVPEPATAPTPMAEAPAAAMPQTTAAMPAPETAPQTSGGIIFNDTPSAPADQASVMVPEPPVIRPVAPQVSQSPGVSGAYDSGSRYLHDSRYARIRNAQRARYGSSY